MTLGGEQRNKIMENLSVTDCGLKRQWVVYTLKFTGHNMHEFEQDVDPESNLAIAFPIS